MFRGRMLTSLLLFAVLAPAAQAQIGKNVLIPAGSDLDHQLNAINSASDPAEKLKLIDEFSAANPTGDIQILAQEQYVNYYIGSKEYDKAFAAGDKLFALDPDNFNNAVNMVRAANEKGDVDKLFAYGEKTGGILQRFKALPPPAGTEPSSWDQQKQVRLSGVKDNQDYIEQSLLSSAFQQKEAAKRAELLARFAKIFPDSPNATQAWGAAALAYQQAQNRPKMLEIANGLLAKDPNNLGMLLLLADDYSEKNEQLDKAEAYAKKAAALCDTAKKPENISDTDWQKQIYLQKGLALSALGQVNLEKKDNAAAVDSLAKAAPLLKSNAVPYARNQYRLGFAYINLKKTAEAKQAFTDAASVDSPYKAPAQEKLKGLAAAKAGARRRS